MDHLKFYVTIFAPSADDLANCGTLYPLHSIFAEVNRQKDLT